MAKILKRAALAGILLLLIALALVSCSKNDGTLEYKSVKGGYEVTGIVDSGAKDIVIPEKIGSKPVVAIAEGAFRGTNIESVTIPATVERVGLNAFEYCAALKTVKTASPERFASVVFENIYANPLSNGAELYVGENVVSRLELNCETVADYAYAGCESIEEIILSGTKEIGVGGFSSLTALKRVSLGESLEIIGASAFSACPLLEAISLPDSTKQIGHSAFSYNSALASVSLPSGVEKIEDRVFSNCTSLAQINLENIKSIGGYAFYNCSALELLTLSAKTEEIGEYAFYNCGLVTVEVPDASALKSIGEAAFRGCVALMEIRLDRAAALKSIGDQAFEYCVSLKNLTLPQSLEAVGEWAFSGCDSLLLNEFGGVGYIGGEGNEYILLYKLIDKENSEITVAAGTKFIAESAFINADNLVTVKIKKNVVSIGAQAFAFCSSLKTVVFPSSLRKIGDGAFMGCSELATVNFMGSKDQWNDSKNENYVNKGTNWKFNAGKYSIFYNYSE